MTIDKMRAGNEAPKILTFDDMSKELYALPEGENKLYFVLSKGGKPLFRNDLEGEKRGLVLVDVRAEAKHEIDGDQNVIRVGTGYNVYEYVTDINDDTFVGAYSDTEYLIKEEKAGNTYMSAIDFMRLHGKGRKPEAGKKVEQKAALTSPDASPAIRAEMTDGERRAREITQSAAQYYKETTELLETIKFKRIQHNQFLKSGIMDALQTMQSHENDVKAARGVTISRSNDSFRGKNIRSTPRDPRNLAKTLTIRVWLETEAMLGTNMISKFGGRKARLAGIRGELEKIDRGEPSELLALLQKEGYEQVRLEVGSWRSRAEERYSLHIPIIGIAVPKPVN